MGRWAEVYFTAPPEKREEAVAALLRELESGSPPREPVSVQLITDENAGEEIEEADGKNETQEAAFSPPSAAEPVGTCRVCNHNNALGQRFCGMCGTPLHVSPTPQVAEAVPVSAVSWSEPGPSPGANTSQYAIGPDFRSTDAAGKDDAPEPAWTLPDQRLPNDGLESEPVSYGYRLFIGAAIAILLATLVYVAWRSTKAVPGTAIRFAPSIAIPAAEPSATVLKQPSTTGTESPEGSSPSSPVKSENRPVATSRKNKPADAPQAPTVVHMAANSSSVVAEPSGAEDLATAEKYLNGAEGLPRDSRVAALWLWKAVGKGNLAATMTLSDLYLRGDGVPKSCDQARLLLDAAARKGGAAAAERLRNLQAFGCD